MIEIIYKEEKQEGREDGQLFRIPRNIRQIGLVSGNCRIYLEDYVYTFLGRLSEKAGASGESQGVLAVFTGESRWAEGIAYVFVRGALEVEDGDAAAEHIDFTEKIWTRIHEEQELYFPDQEIVGWFFSQPGLPMESTDLMTKVHLKYFAGGEKILMLMDPAEKEDGVFLYENNFMAKQEGYYLFYERNPQMQAYMMEKLRGEPTETSQEVPDEAVKAFRKIVRGRNRKQKGQPEETERTERPSVFSYAATACLVIAVLTVGGGFYRNYQEMLSMDEEADALSMEDFSAIETGSGGDSVRGEETGQDADGAEEAKNEKLPAGNVQTAASKISEGNGQTGTSKGSGENGQAGTSKDSEKNEQASTSKISGGGSQPGASGVSGGGSQSSATGVSVGSSRSNATGVNGGNSQSSATGVSGGSSQSSASGVSGEDSQSSASGTTGGNGQGSVTKTGGEEAASGSAAKSTQSSGTGSQGSSAGSAGKVPAAGDVAAAERQSSSSGSAGDVSAAGDNAAAGKSAAADSGTDVSGQDDEDTIFQEESDVRKAKRRQALLEQQNSASAASEEVHASYVIRPGDTLYEISMEKYGTMDAISEICRLNGLSREEIIYPGQIIVLP